MSDDVPEAEVVLSCTDLDRALDVFGRAGFQVDRILPADDPRDAVISGHGVRLRLLRPAQAAVVSTPPPHVPSFVVTRNDERAWKVGRAGMHYRDLVPDRLGGRFIASHIRIPKGGPVPDYVHYHAIRFQMIHCYKGWVRLVYEDQGPPFVLSAGECVLQPPKIRHRVLECSPGLEVIEIGSPAVHATFGDHEMTLPTSVVRADRVFGGQRFVCDRVPAGRSIAPSADAASGPPDIASASGGTGSVCVRRSGDTVESVHDAELFFGFVLEGGMTVSCDGSVAPLVAGDAFVIPATKPYSFDGGTSDLAWLEVTAPAAIRRDPI